MGGGGKWFAARLVGAVSCVLFWLQVTHIGASASATFPLPEELRPNVAFWKRIFAVLDTRSGVLHDPDDVNIIYHTLYDLPESPQERQEILDTYRVRYRSILESLAQGKRQNLDSDETRVLTLFKGKQTPAVLREAADNIRFQPGIRDRFADGLVRSVSLLADIEHIFVAAGLPPELALLPHVESSFNSKANSKAGAAGLWQFMPATGKRFMRIDRRVDERLDVRLSTIAATKLLRENYEELGTWPLAITAYNHGTNGMKQAVASVGTTDFGTIVQQYRGPLFGFASKNFYAEFLAALEVTKHHKVHFADLALPRSPYIQTAESDTPSSTRVAKATAGASITREYRVQPGDTLSGIARQFDTTAPTLAVLNGIEARDMLVAGQVLTLPPITAQQEVAGPLRTQATVTPKVVAEPSKAQAAVTPKEVAAPSKAQATGTAAKRVAVKKYQVRSGDTLWEIAQRFDTTVPTLVALNGLQKQQSIKPGSVLSLPSAAPQTVATAPVSRQPAAAPKRYQVRPGDTLWSIAQRFRTTVPTLVELNGLKPRQQIKPGQVLTLPPPSLQEAAQPTPVRVTNVSYMPHGATAPRLPRTAEWWRVKNGTMHVAAQENLGLHA
jgi:membrane-bound lytic murein transglycosylase D